MVVKAMMVVNWTKLIESLLASSEVEAALLSPVIPACFMLY